MVGLGGWWVLLCDFPLTESRGGRGIGGKRLSWKKRWMSDCRETSIPNASLCFTRTIGGLKEVTGRPPGPRFPIWNAALPALPTFSTRGCQDLRGQRWRGLYFTAQRSQACRPLVPRVHCGSVSMARLCSQESVCECQPRGLTTRIMNHSAQR